MLFSGDVTGQLSLRTSPVTGHSISAAVVMMLTLSSLSQSPLRQPVNAENPALCLFAQFPDRKSQCEPEGPPLLRCGPTHTETGTLGGARVTDQSQATRGGSAESDVPVARQDEF